MTKTIAQTNRFLSAAPRTRPTSLNTSQVEDVCVCVCMYVCMYVCIFIFSEYIGRLIMTNTYAQSNALLTSAQITRPANLSTSHDQGDARTQKRPRYWDPLNTKAALSKRPCLWNAQAHNEMEQPMAMSKQPQHDRSEWQAIGKKPFRARTTVQQYQYDRPITTGRWRADEGIKLEQAVERNKRTHDFPNWQAVGESVDGRTRHQCANRYYGISNPAVKTSSVDAGPNVQQMTEGDTQHLDNWTTVAERFGGRTVKQCEDHYNYSKDAKKGKWSAEEDLKLRQAIERFRHPDGRPDWTSIVGGVRW